MTIKCKLEPIYDNAKSFYGKANVNKMYKDNVIIQINLISYITDICYIKEGKLYFNYKDIDNKSIYSMTTLRHIKEFLKQYNFLLDEKFRNIIEKEKLTKNDIKKLVTI